MLQGHIKVFCYSSSKYWLKEGHYKPKEVQKDKASKRRTVLPKEGQLTPMRGPCDIYSPENYLASHHTYILEHNTICMQKVHIK